MIQYRLIALGFACVAVNLTVNGTGILLPTCIGYALIAMVSWSLRDTRRAFFFAVVPAGLLVTISFPDLFYDYAAVSMPWYETVFWAPRIVLHLALLALLGLGLWHEAEVYGEKSIQHALLIGVPVSVAGYVGWYLFPVDGTTSLLLSTLMYDASSLYCLGLFLYASSKLD